MILADTSVWIDHLRRSNSGLKALLTRGIIVMHPFVLGEIALGSLRNRDAVVAELRLLPSTDIVAEDEVMHFVNSHQLWGTGIGWVDVHLLASAQLSQTRMWTMDRRLSETGARLKLDYVPSGKFRSSPAP